MDPANTVAPEEKAATISCVRDVVSAPGWQAVLNICLVDGESSVSKVATTTVGELTVASAAWDDTGTWPECGKEGWTV